ncbi:Ras-GEF domain-containing family member 1B-A [Toxocara canis]|uniref:Ras-GEF domain-containing family member 1B-A n=1 Tax=Toxocara canis TaxID=6265 RepID=A0A0B2VAG9_TOXCA|nr:Ras-GEF domain-containing family member 1B-A [Toxocara canis]
MIVPLYNGHATNENNNTIDVANGLDCGNTAGYHTFQQNDVVYDEDGTVISGSAEALIRRLIPTHDYCPDRPYIFTLLLNIRTFVAPSELLHKVLQHCMFEQNATGANFTKEGRTRMFANIFKLCSEWTQNMPYDFRDKAMRQRLGELLGLCSVDERSKMLTERLFADLQNTLNRLERYERAIANLSPNNSEKLTQSENLTGLCELCPNPLELAQQLTQIESERLCMIGPDEIVYSLLKDNLDTIGKVTHSSSSRSGNIGHYVSWFNQLTVLVASEILRHSKKQCRVRVIEYFIDVAKECINVGNFNSLMAIVAGLSLPPIARLKKTWLRIEKSKLQILQHQLDPSANFTSYRATLKAAIWRSEGAKNDAETIIIPFFGLLLKDMFILHRRCTRLLPNGHLNFASFAQFSEQMFNFVKWKTRRCPFERNSRVLQYLLLSSTFTESDLMKLSYECEVAEQSSEKEHYKKLK